METTTKLTKKQVDSTAEMMARAFINYPMVEFLFPSRKSRLRKSTLYFKAVITYCNKFGRIFITSPECEGACILLDEIMAHYPDKQVIQSGIPWRFARLGLKFLLRLKRQEKHQYELYKTNTPFPHYYIILVAVDPEKQGHGYGSTVIRDAVNWVDDRKMSIYLETYTRKNVEIYKKHGFEMVEASSIPKTDIEFWGMVRPARNERKQGL